MFRRPLLSGPSVRPSARRHRAWNGSALLGHSGARQPAQSALWPVPTSPRAVTHSYFTRRRLAACAAALVSDMGCRASGVKAAQQLIDITQTPCTALEDHPLGRRWGLTACKYLTFSSRRVALCRSRQRHAPCFGAGCAAVARDMWPADRWLAGVQVNRKVVRFRAVGGTHAARSV